MQKEVKEKEKAETEAEVVHWHALSDGAVFTKLNSGVSGLNDREVALRLEKYGKNELKEFRKIKPFLIFLSQFKSFFIYLLLIAAVISALLLHWIDFYAILAIVILNASIGFIQNYRAEKAIQNLRKVLVPKAKVMRREVMQEVSALEVVPGDILVLQEGDKVIADSRIFECHDMQASEAVLTGESMPVDKLIKKLLIETELGDRQNMLYSGTTIVRGSGKAVVVATGMSTEFGKIASLVQEVKPAKTPLQVKIDGFAKKLGLIAVVICIAVAAIGISLGLDRIEMFFTAVSLAVAAVPEGLPAVITICLAIAVRRMNRVKTLIRKLPAAETLGRVSVICTDKTGTLTQEEMTVTQIYYNNEIIDLQETKFSDKDLKRDKTLNLLLKINCLCNNARVEKTDKKEIFIGDPTEKALLRAALSVGLDKKELTEKEVRVKEFSFSSKRKLMSIVRQDDKQGNKLISYVKGAPDVILDRSTKEIIDNKIINLNAGRKQRLLRIYEEIASQGLRVLGFAFKPIVGVSSEKLKQKDAESGLIFVGFQAMLDLPRPEVKQAIQNCKSAGIAINIITGDSALTTATIARMIGLGGESLTGAEIDKLSDSDLSKKIKKVNIFARTTPEHKLRIVNLFKEQGEVVAVTGDGVNDAPALKRADIGISMGIRGTDVARDVSDIVLTDDNFVSISKAVGEGRRVFDNIKKFSYYLISSNLAEIFIIVFVLLLGYKLGWPTLLALLPIQILWINLISDGFIALTLSFEQAEADVMKRKPEKAELFTLHVLALWAVLAIIITVGTLLLFNFLDTRSGVEIVAFYQTVAFTSIVLFEGFNALNFRSFKQPLYKLKANWWLILAILGAFLLQIFIVQFGLLHTTALRLKEWLIIFAVSFSILILGEAFKITRTVKKI